MPATLIALYLITAALCGLLILDWRQTLTIARHPERWSEVNIILGRHPSVRAVHLYFSAVMAATVTLALLPLIPEVARLVVFSLFAGLEGFVTWQNKRHGL